ncbi:hypothetical protein C8Q77DRAFT_829734 [Trametes polyzona]|nr:hypothetical protein C8Q77DRAFT_829734 [Trametes polyzona]
MGSADSTLKTPHPVNMPALATGSTSSKPRPVNRLAPKHTDCVCYLDARCQLAVAYQEAREYWERYPEDAENAPSEIHQAIEKWLIESRILQGPPHTYREETVQDDQSPAASPEFPPKRGVFKLPRIRPRPLNLRRFSLPGGETPSQRLSGTPNGPRRRHTTDETNGGLLNSFGGGPSAPPLSPRKLLRGVGSVFWSKKSKRTSDSAAPSGSASEEAHQELHSDNPACCGSTQSLAETMVGVEGKSTLEYLNINEDAASESVYEDAPEIIAVPKENFPIMDPERPLGRAVACTADLAPTTPEEKRAPRLIRPLETNSHPVPDSPCGLDPATLAHTALAQIIWELDALAEHPRYAAIAASHGDADYALFWDAFGQLSAREVLMAVYALRSGALDEPDLSELTVGGGPPGDVWAMVVVVLGVWALGASAMVGYLLFVRS